jgi:single-strand DNA-binding protein
MVSIATAAPCWDWPWSWWAWPKSDPASLPLPASYTFWEVHMNRVMLIGRLSKDPDFRYTASGTALAKLTLATDRLKRNGEEQPPDWHRITVWGKLAEICAQYLTKDRQIMIEGRIEFGSYEKDGVKHYTTDIVADNMQMLGTRGDGEYREPREPSKPAGICEADIPF